jgi:glycopeptide antibiotics resistance protein
MFRDLSFDIWPLGLVLLIFPLVLAWRRTHSIPCLICVAVFSAYIVMALQKTFFPLMISGTYPDSMRQVPFMNAVNLIPFYPGPWGYSESFFVFNMQNILLTMPFGFGISFIARLRAKDFVWLAPALGVSIELAQLLIGLLLRYPFRVVDVNDAIMNALGVLIGYSLFRGFARLYLWATQRSQFQHRGLTAHIYDVTSHATSTRRDSSPSGKL